MQTINNFITEHWIISACLAFFGMCIISILINEMIHKISNIIEVSIKHMCVLVHGWPQIETKTENKITSKAIGDKYE